MLAELVDAEAVVVPDATVGVAVAVVVDELPLVAVVVLDVVPDTLVVEVVLVVAVLVVVALLDVVLLTAVVLDVLVVGGVVEVVPPSAVVVVVEALPTEIVTDLLAVPEEPLQVILMVMFPYNGNVERLPDVATKFVMLPLVAMHEVADVADQVTSDVPPLVTDSGFAVSWMTGAASARGSSTRSVSA